MDSVTVQDQLRVKINDSKSIWRHMEFKACLVLRPLNLTTVSHFWDTWSPESSECEGLTESHTGTRLIIWPAPRAGKTELSCPLGTTRHDPQEKIPKNRNNKFFIDQACLVEMAGCSFFACLWTLTPSRSISTKKKN